MGTLQDSILFLRLYNWLCMLAPIQQKETVVPGKTCMFMRLILLLFLLAFLGSLYYINWKLIYHEDATTVLLILDHIQNYGPLAMNAVLFIESAVKYDKDFQIWDTIRQVDESSSELYTEQSNHVFFNRFLKIFTVLIGLSPITIIIIITGVFRDSPGWAVSWIFRFLPVMCMYTCMSQYVFYVVFISDKLDKIKVELADILGYSVENSKFREKIIRERLVSLKKLYRAVWELFMRLDSRFHMFLWITLVNALICLNTSIYWIGIRIHTKFYLHFIESAMCLFPYMIPMTVLVNVCEELRRKIELVAPDLHRLSLFNYDPRTLVIIRKLSLQLLLSNRFAEKSFIGLFNYSKVFKLFYGLSTYFFIIFTVKEI